MSITTPHATIQRLEKQAGRVHEVVQVLVKYRLAGWLRTIPAPWLHESMQGPEGTAIKDLSREVRIRLALGELGTTYIKLGQMLSTRADLVGPELASELSKLQSQTPPDPPEVVKESIERELGKPPDEIFAQFEARSFASASVAQVHRAQLPTGEMVVVKVQKAGIHKKVEEDLSILASLAKLIEKHSPELKAYQPVGLVEEFGRILLNELDFKREHRNLDTFGRNFADDETVRFPKAYSEFCSRRVLTMDFMDGILGSDIEKLRESGADLGEFAKRGATIYLDMIFRDSFYHADPHPGNLMLLPGDVVGIIDCGMVGRLDEGLHDDFESLMMAVSQGDAEILTDTLWKLSSERPTLQRERLQADLSDLLADTADVSLNEINLGEILTNLTAIVRKYKISLQPALSALLKTLVLLEGTAELLDPRFSLAEVMQPYTEKILLERFSPKRIGHRLARSYRDWDRLLETLPRDLGEALGQFQSGKFQIRLEHRNLDSIVNRLVLGIIVSALLVGSSLLWSLKAPPLLDGISVFGAAGYVLALILGGLLFRAIEKSGKVSSKN